MDLSVVIINFNTKKLTEQCISSVLSSTECNYEIIVVDNSTDESERYSSLNSKVRVITAENHGFGHACNIGMKASNAEFYLMLNSDTIVHKGAIDKCLEYIKAHENIGAAGGKTLLADGTLDHSCKRGLPTPSASLYYMLGLDKKHPENPKYGQYHLTYLDENQINEVEVLSGAFMMIRASIIDSIGMFDEDYFMYCEDVDLCYRIGNAGYKLIYLPEAVITHLKGQSGLSARSKFVIKHFYRSMKLFYKKNFKGKYSIFTMLAVYLAIDCKKILALIKSK